MPHTRTFLTSRCNRNFYLEAGKRPGYGLRLPQEVYIMGSMLRVTVINTLSAEKHFIYKTDLTAQFVCNAEHSSQTPAWPCEPWLLLWCQLFHRELWNGSDEWGPVRLHSLGGLESIQLSVTLPALTVMNTMQAADNTPIHYKEKKKRIDG